MSQDNSNNLSSSPYSLYGLGVSNETSTGKTNSLGKSGIAIPSITTINNLNPASFASIPEGKFLFDLGVKVERETLYDIDEIEKRFNGNFSNVAIAFPLSKKSGIGLVLIPYTNVGYSIQNIEFPIDGTNENFLANISGYGGLNDIRLNYGYKINPKFRFGIGGSFLFGKITEEEIDLIGDSTLGIFEESFYNGFRLNLGMQYEITDNLSFGSIVNLPTKLDGYLNRIVFTNESESTETESDLDEFKLPLEFGVGFHANLKDNLLFNLDYKRSFWNATNQSDLIGDYVDQNFFGFGIEYIPKATSLNYWKRINYRTGFNFDDGNLAINDSRIMNYAINFGIGLPISNNRSSLLNISYSFGQKGQISNGLIKENYHTISLNLSLEDLWFQKRKFN